MTLAERMNVEDDSGNKAVQHKFGSRKMSYVINKAPKFERLRQQQEEHHKERRGLQRSTFKLKGKFKIKEPLMTLAERMNVEDDSGNKAVQHKFGSREMSYVINKAPKFERLRQQQEEHHKERRGLQRSIFKLNGKFKIKEPL